MLGQDTIELNGVTCVKILLVTPYFFPKNYGGAPYVYKKIIDLSVNSFCVFTDYDSSMANEIRAYDEHSGIRTVRSKGLIFKIDRNRHWLVNYYTLALHIATTIFNYAKCIIMTRPDIVICGQVYEVGWLCTLDRLFGIKTICYVHGEEISTKRPGGLWARIRSFLAERVVCKSLGVLVVSRYTKNVITEKFNARGKVLVINNGVDTDNFYPAPKDSYMLEKYQIRDSFVLLSLCRLVPKKGLDLVIRSINDIAKENCTFKYLIGGIGPDLDRLKSLVVECGVADKVVFAGFIEDKDLNSFMNLGDLFVMPNRAIEGDTEGFGLVFLQANACGLPVIAGKAGGTSDAVQDGKSGFLVDGEDRVDFISRVVEILKDDAMRLELSEFGLNWARESCSWELRVKQFDQVSDELVRAFG